MKKIAIVGSVFGLYAVYLLHKTYDLTIYEKTITLVLLSNTKY